MYIFDEISKIESESDYYTEPKPRFEKPRPVSKATSRRGELLERCMNFLDYKNKDLFGMKTSHLSVDDLEWLLSISKAWKVNGPALFWKKIKESTPK